MAARRPHHVPPTTAASFATLGVPTVLVDALAATGVVAPRPIQAATLPDALAGRDVLGRARTGSGKTYAFALPVLARLAGGRPARPGMPRALILVPTRELAAQIETAIAPLAKALRLRTLTVFGGVRPGPQISGLRAGVDILVACPGRLADHVNTGHARLDGIEITVLDEADHMADLGFLPVVQRLLDRTPATGQRMLFSATLDAAVDGLVRRYLTNPARHSVDSAQTPIAEMSHHVLHVRDDDRLPILAELASAPGRTLVFTRTKSRARALTKRLIALGVPAVELHGNLAQTARSRNLLAFSDGSVETLVATDIAARGIHVDDVTLVVHADPPTEHKAYLHRSGRTARSGAQGTVITLMTDAQVGDVRALVHKAGIRPRTTRLSPGHPLLAELAPGERTFTPPPVVPDKPPVTRVPKPRRVSGSAGRSHGRTDRPRAAAPAQDGGARSHGRTDRPRAAPAADAAAFSARSRVGGRRGSR